LKQYFNSKYRLLLAGLILLLLTFLFDYLGTKVYVDLKHKVQLHHIKKSVIKKENTIQAIFSKLKSEPVEELSNDFDKYIQFSKEQNIYLYIYELGELVFWTNNEVLPSRTNSQNDVPQLQKLGNGYYLQVNTTFDGYIYVALIPIQAVYPIENKYLQNTFIFDNKNYKFRISHSISTDNDYNIYSNEGTYLFSLMLNFSKTSSNWILYLYLIGGMLIMIFINNYIHFLFRQKQKLQGYLLASVTLLITILGWRVLHYPRSLFELPIFSSGIYASSFLFASLGDLLVTVVLILWTVNLITVHARFTLPQNKIIRISFIIFSLMLSTIMAVGIFDLLESIIMDSNIIIDMTNLFNINQYSFITVIIIFLLFYSFIQISYYLYRKIIKHGASLSLWISGAVITIVSFFIYAVLAGDHYYLTIIYVVLVWLIFYFFKPVERSNVSTVLILILLSSGFAAHRIQISNNQKEYDNRKHLIESLSSDRDVIGEELLGDVVNQLSEDNYLMSYFDNPLISKYLLKRRIKHVYFTGYFTKYDFNIYTYTYSGMAFKEYMMTPLYYSSFMKIMHLGQPLENNKNIFFINNYYGAPAYLIYLQVKKDNQVIGQVIIELKQKTLLEESVYPELLIERTSKKLEILKNYSYAIYKDIQLTNQKGSFSYPLTFLYENNSNEPYYIIRDNKYNHLIYRLSDNIVIVMSKQVNNVFDSLALFSALFILATFLMLFIFYYYKIKPLLEPGEPLSSEKLKLLNPFGQLSFKFKIQLTILLTVFIAILLTGFTTISYIRIKFIDNTTSKLSEEISAVTHSLDGYFKENLEFSNIINKDELYSRVRNLTNLFHSDINIFDIDGDLITSSQMPIYDRKIISEKLDAEAFYQLRMRQKSQLVQTESIGSHIKYISAYSPLRNANNKIFAYVNIPYFSQEQDLKQQISSLIVTIVNLYVFLFLIILIISFTISNTFTEPLEIIRRHLHTTQLGQANKQISWESTDEIGLLISEYNEMLLKLQKSAEALAISERETAWREMAKQVAHEIKNPLTPMKLNIQQLMRAWEDKAPDLEERFKKITQILINRIDNLSQIATEFSAFARMPEAVHTEVIVESVLKEVTDLFIVTEDTEINLNLKTSETRIYADPDQLIRLFNNLIKNAIQSVPKELKGIIDISTAIENNDIIIKVADNGTGIHEEVQDKIFLPNFSTKSSGMGLGLAIVSRIIANANGKIWFETVEGKGTTFFISFPVTKEA
jgi:signal transduction histidine kinase